MPKSSTTYLSKTKAKTYCPNSFISKEIPLRNTPNNKKALFVKMFTG